MINKTRPVRLNKEEAQKWMKAHRDVLNAPACRLDQRPGNPSEVVKGAKALAGEVTGVSVKGSLFRPVIGDGWGTFLNQVGGIRYEVKREGLADRHEFKGRTTGDKFPAERTVKVFKNREAYEATLKARARRKNKYEECPIRRGARQDTLTAEVLRQRVHTSTFNFGLPAQDTDAFFGASQRTKAEGEIKARGELRPTTVTLGVEPPASLLINKREFWADRTVRERRVISLDAMPLNADGDNPVDLVPDTRTPEVVALEELWELLRSEGVTEKEAEALDNRAHGEASSARMLMRARVKAGKIIVKWRRMDYAFNWTAV